MNEILPAEEIDLDPPGDGEVLVSWEATGLCHSDEHIRTGDLPAIQVGARKLWRIEDQALEDYIQRQLASTSTPPATGPR